MIRFHILFLALVQMAFSQGKSISNASPYPKSDSAFVAKVDSLARILEKEKLSAEYAKESLQAYKDANENIRTQYGFFVGSTILVLIGGFSGIGWFIYRRSKDERAYVASETEKLVMPRLQPQLDIINQAISEQTRIVNNNFQLFLDTRNKVTLLEIKTQSLDQMQSTVVRLDVTLLYEEYRRNQNLIETHTYNRELDRAYRIAIGALSRFKQRDDTSHFSDIYMGYVEMIRKIFREAKGIRSTTKEAFEGHLSLFAPAHVTELKILIDQIPVEEVEQTGLLRNFGDVFYPVKESVF